MPGQISPKHLHLLPFHTLAAIAMAVARDIDAGAHDKRALLETIFKAIGRAT